MHRRRRLLPVRLIKRVFSTDKGYLTLILKLNFAFLALLIVLAIFLPLSSSERWTLLLVETFLVGVNWAFLTHAKKQ